ncbi:MAG: hypothetical protein CL913_08120 [Deltaproteobacteria bacterium]|nr:hypothetical protein [Deltaproteobacteria bacterium]
MIWINFTFVMYGGATKRTLLSIKQRSYQDSTPDTMYSPILFRRLDIPRISLIQCNYFNFSQMPVGQDSISRESMLIWNPCKLSSPQWVPSTQFEKLYSEDSASAQQF